MKFRSFPALALVVLCAMATASAALLPGYTAADQKMFDKLSAQVGTWHCVDTPASKKPDVAITKLQGSYYVTRETGDFPSTTYMRWSHTFQRYLANSVADGGAMSVMQTMSKDPNNATWTYAYPTSLPKGNLFPAKTSMSGNTTTTTQAFRDNKGKVMMSKSVCTKQ